MPDTETTLTPDQLKEIQARLKQWDRGEISKQTFPVSWAEADALCRSLRAAWQWKREALPLLTRYDNLAETFDGSLGSSKVANLERGVAALREQLATQRESITTFQENEKSLKAQLAQVVTLTKREARILTDYHYYEAEKAITRWGCKAAQRAHLERLAELRKTYEPTD